MGGLLGFFIGVILEGIGVNFGVLLEELSLLECVGVA